MRKLLLYFLGCAAQVPAQNSEFTFFQAALLPVSNEGSNVTFGYAAITAHVVRGAAGQISGSLTFDVSAYSLGRPDSLLGLHIHRGKEGEDGPVVFDSGLGTPLPQPITGITRIVLQAQAGPDDAPAVAALRDLLQNPADFYVDLHAAGIPAGARRSQLQKAELHVFGSLMSSNNTVPPVTAFDARGFGYVFALISRDRNGSPTGALVLTRIAYEFNASVSFSGVHIHEGKAGEHDPSMGVWGWFTVGGGGISRPSTGVIDGSTSLGPAFGYVSGSFPPHARLLNALLTSPSDFYIDAHTTTAPNGAIRGQLRRMDRIDIPILASPANEAPPVSGLDATAIGTVTLSTLRFEDGSVAAGLVYFDINHRFPANTRFTGMHLHQGATGQSGDIRIPSAIPAQILSPTGFGNINSLVHVDTGPALTALDAIVRSPEGYYFNLHTTQNPGGAVRAQLGPANIGAPVITSVVSANLDPASGAIAPNGLFTIFGRNLAKLASNLDGWEGSTLPEGLNGAAVGMGAGRARLLYVSPGQINAVAPVDVATGMVQVAVNNGAAVSAPFNARVAATAPAIFVYGASNGAVLKNAGFSLVSAANPAGAGDVLLVYSTGLGLTTPTLASGRLVPSTGQYDTAPVTATLDGRPADVIYSIATPGAVGLYQTAIRVPPGIAAGARPLALTAGGVTSNIVRIALR
jgi:uncharacterized protein (TIGR03437 family)